MQIYVVAVLVSLILIAILFFALRSTVKRIDYNTKKYFVDKLQDYDYLIEEKQQILDKLNEEIEKNKKIINEEKPKEKIEIKKADPKYYGNQKVPRYEDQKLFEKYKKIKEKFNFNHEKIIKKFIDNNITEDNVDYSTLKKVREKFSNEIIYKIINSKPEDQKKYISNMLSQSEKNTLKKYFDVDKCKISDFITQLDVLIEKNDPTIYVLTGDEKRNYEHISNKIKTIYDKTINEGIKISYKGILYDYSL